MKRLLIILPILSLIVAGCYKEPFADATINPNPAWVGEDIAFFNLSQNVEHVEWDMGDGNTGSSFNITHFYYDPGIYNVTLTAFGKKNDVDRASFIVDVDGSELKIIAKDVDFDDVFIEGASVLLFETKEDWFDGDPAIAFDEQITDRYGECFFSNLSYQKYYVDVWYRVGNEGYINWLLGEEDLERWVETQELPGELDHTFIAYADWVTFNDSKKSTGRPAVRPQLREIQTNSKSGSTDRPIRENKISIKKERQ